MTKRIPSMTVEHVQVFRCGMTGRRYRRRWVAYRSAAQKAWLRRYCCCEGAEERYGGEANDKYWNNEYRHRGDCGAHDTPDRDKVIIRLARWLRWRDGREGARG